MNKKLCNKLKLMSNPVKVKFKKLNENAVIPTKGSDFAGGWDVVATEIEQTSDDFVICKLGFALEIPEGYKLTLVPRSSFTKTQWILQNSPGLGDSDYRGEYQYRFRAIPVAVWRDNWIIRFTNFLRGVDSEFCFVYPEFPFKVGDRVGQIYIEEVIPTEFEEVESLDDSDRGEGGFGSTDK